MSTLKTPQVAKSIVDMQGLFSYTPYRKKEVLIKSSILYLKKEVLIRQIKLESATSFQERPYKPVDACST